MMSNELNRVSDGQRAVINRYLSSYPVKLGALARELGVAIKISSMRPGVSGQITNEGGQYVIRVNRNEARERQRFTIGHELGHFLLHKNVIDSSPNGITDNVLYRSGASEQIEFEANRLAADLTMPFDLVQQKLRSDFQDTITQASIESLAASFEVSKAAMEIRLSAFASA